jgi:hypothetical protein
MNVRLNGCRTRSIGENQIIGQHRLKRRGIAANQDQLGVDTVFFEETRILSDPNRHVESGGPTVASPSGLRIGGCQPQEQDHNDEFTVPKHGCLLSASYFDDLTIRTMH